MGLELFFASFMPPVPAVQHTADRRIAGVAGHPDFAIIMLLIQVLLEDLKAFTFAFFIGMLVDCIFIITDMFPRMLPRRTHGSLVSPPDTLYTMTVVPVFPVPNIKTFIQYLLWLDQKNLIGYLFCFYLCWCRRAPVEFYLFGLSVLEAKCLDNDDDENPAGHVCPEYTF